MNKPKLVQDRLIKLIKSQNKLKHPKLTYDKLNTDDIQVDVNHNRINLDIQDLTKILYGTGFNRLLITIGDKSKLIIISDRYAYAIRSGKNCNIKSIYTSDRDPIYTELGEHNQLVYRGAHDIKSSKGTTFTHVSTI